MCNVHKAEVVQDSMGTNISVAAFAPLWHVSLKVAVVLHNSPLQNLAPLTGCHCQYSAVEFYCAAVAQLKVQNSSCELEHEMDLTKWMSCTLIWCYEYHHMNMNISSSFNYYILRLQLFDQKAIRGHIWAMDTSSLYCRTIFLYLCKSISLKTFITFTFQTLSDTIPGQKSFLQQWCTLI